MSLAGSGRGSPRVAQGGSGNKLENLQVLRFAAALLVVLTHVVGHYAWFGGTVPLNFLIMLGLSGVDIFFVISGFIIHRSTLALGGPRDVLHFAMRRASRIYLPFWAITAATAAIIFATGNQALVATVDWPKSLLLLPVPVSAMPLDVAWTLTFELLFYAFFAVAILVSAHRQAIIVAGGLATVALAIYAAWNGAHSGIMLLPAGSIALFIEFFLGIAVSAISMRYNSERWFLWLAVGVAALLVAAGAYFWSGAFPYNDAGFLLRVLVYGGPAAIIVFAVASMEREVRPPRILVLLGDASYALYLIHRAVLLVIWNVLPSLGVTFAARWPAVGAVASIAFSIVVALQFYRWIERPMLAWVGRNLPKRRACVRPSQLDEEPGEVQPYPEGHPGRHVAS